MTDYTYGPWTVHTPGECPLPPDTLVLVQRRDMTQIRADKSPICTAGTYSWDDLGIGTIAYYRIARAPEWRVETGWFGIDGTFVGAKGCHAQFCIHWPMINGQPDFTQQPKWERV